MIELSDFIFRAKGLNLPLPHPLMVSLVVKWRFLDNFSKQDQALRSHFYGKVLPHSTQIWLGFFLLITLFWDTLYNFWQVVSHNSRTDFSTVSCFFPLSSIPRGNNSSWMWHVATFLSSFLLLGSETAALKMFILMRHWQLILSKLGSISVLV